MDSIRIKRGPKALLPSELPLGELAFCTDTRELYVGMGSGSKLKPVTNTEITEHLAKWEDKYQEFSEQFQTKYEGLEQEYATRLTEIDGHLSQISNPNLIINGDFQILDKEFIATGNVTIDCMNKWYLRSNNDANTVSITKENGKCKMSTTSYADGLTGLYYYFVENMSNKLKDKVCTLTIDVESITGEHKAVIQRKDTPYTTYLQLPLSVGKNIVTGTISSSLNELLAFYLRSYSVGEIVINSIKLEYGEVSTPFHSNHYYEDLMLIRNGVVEGNPNLLINGDFQVWQRGTNFTHAHGYYCADRWMMFMADVNGNFTWSKTANGIKALCTKETVNYFSRIWYTLTERERVQFENKEFTVTIRYKTNIDNAYLLCRGISDTPLTKSENDFNTIVKTFTFSNIDRYMLGVQVGNTKTTVNPNDFLEIDFIKVELGKVSTPYNPVNYYEDLLLCNDGVVGGNPNLLINGDFQVWQRGENLTPDVMNYGADRWIHTSSKTTVEKIEKGARFTRTEPGNIYIRQRIHKNQFKKWKGKNLVFSVKFKGNGFAFQVYDRVNTKVIYASPSGINTNGEYLIYEMPIKNFSYNDNVEYLEFSIVGASATELEIEWAKLEFGDVATPFHPRSYAEELRECQRYYTKIISPVGSGISGIIDKDNSWLSGFLFPVSMRIAPTCKVNKATTTHTQAIEQYVIPHRIDEYGCGIFDVKTYPNRQPGELIRILNFEADAEIY